MKKSTRVIGSVIAGAILVGLALLSKDDVREYEMLDGDNDENTFEEGSNNETIDVSEGEVEA